MSPPSWTASALDGPKARSGLWQDAQARRPEAESDGSPNMVRPSVERSATWRRISARLSPAVGPSSAAGLGAGPITRPVARARAASVRLAWPKMDDFNGTRRLRCREPRAPADRLAPRTGRGGIRDETASALRDGPGGHRPLARPGGPRRGRRRRPPAEARPDPERRRDLRGEPELRQPVRLVPRRQRPRPGQRDRQGPARPRRQAAQRAAGDLGRADGQGRDTASDPGRDRAPGKRAVRGRRPEGVRPPALYGDAG